MQDNLVRDVKATLYLMWGGALFVLLIGCVNIAGLLTARGVPVSCTGDLPTALALLLGELNVHRGLIEAGHAVRGGQSQLREAEANERGGLEEIAAGEIVVVVLRFPVEALEHGADEPDHETTDQEPAAAH